MKPDLDEPTPPKRTSRPIQPTLVLYVPGLEPGADSGDTAVGDALGKLKGWKEFSQAYGGAARLAPRRAFKDSPGIDKLIARANENVRHTDVRGYRPLDYKRYFLLSLPKGVGSSVFDTYCELKAGLTQLGGQVFLSMPTQHAQASNNYVAASQVAGGVGASQLVSGVSNKPIDGAGQWIVDIEKAWLTTGINSNHPVLSLPSRVNAVESAELADINHGTAVAGIVLGAGANPPLGGLAPNARFSKGACLELAGTADPSQILASTILDAAVFLMTSPRGSGVILIEQETWDALPIETQPLEFAAIQTAAAAGHIVVQPSGNGGQNLDGVSGMWFDASNTLVPRSLDPSQGGPTSGAVVVAAAFSGHDATGGKLGERSPSSNFGHIVDCWAWGDSIATLGVTRNAAGDPIGFPDPAGFGGTSGSAAIVAGATLLMQQLRQEAGRPQLNAGELRVHLRDTALGTPGQGDLSDKGMPDLAKLRPVLER